MAYENEPKENDKKINEIEPIEMNTSETNGFENDFSFNPSADDLTYLAALENSKNIQLERAKKITNEVTQDIKWGEGLVTESVNEEKELEISPNTSLSKEEIEQNYSDFTKGIEASVSKEKSINVEQKEFTNEELMEKMKELMSQVESLKEQLSSDTSVEKVDVKKESKINFSKIGEFKDSKVSKAKETIEAKKDEFISKIDKKKQMVQAYAELATNNKFTTGVKATKAVFDKHIKDPVSDKVSIKTLKGLEKVGEYQTKIGSKLKKLEEAISLKTESIMVQNELDPNNKVTKYETFLKASFELGKEATASKFNETSLGKQISKISKMFKEKSKEISATYSEKSKDVTLKQQNAKDKIKNLSTNM